MRQLRRDDSQLLQTLRAMPGELLSFSDDELAAQVVRLAQMSGGAEQAATWATTAMLCRHNHMKPSALAELVQSVALMEVTDNFLNNQFDLVHAQAQRQTRDVTNEYMAAHWPEVHEWLNFPRGFGVWSAVLIAVIAVQPLLAVFLVLLFWGLFMVLAFPL
jgi:hypothetical protein